MSIAVRLSLLADRLRQCAPVAIAFSGGVDSSVLAKAAVLFLSGPRPPALLAFGATSTADDLSAARTVAEEIGVRLIELPTDEMSDPSFLQNGPDRCYHCKRVRFDAIFAALRKLPKPNEKPFTLLDGSNADDLADYRPGNQAAAEHSVQSPLADLGFHKEEIRLLAKRWSLSNADRPSNPCLVTRLAYGLLPTEERLRKIELTEDFLHRVGFSVCRVRFSANRPPSVEVPVDDIPRLQSEGLWKRVVEMFRAENLPEPTLDAEGFISGKMNRSLKLRGA